MDKKIWKNTLNSLAKEATGVISEEDVDTVADMLTVDKIDLKVFFRNLEALFMESTSPSGLLDMDKIDPSPSMCLFVDPSSEFSAHKINLPFPLWFYIAYPDVVKWFREWQLEHVRPDKFDGKKMATEKMKLFGIKETNIAKSSVINKEGQHRPQYLKNLVKNYRDKTGNELEMTVKKFSEYDIYTKAEVQRTINLIAEITTKFYLELQKNYEDFFIDKARLIATAGIIYAQSYIFLGEIKISEVISIAKETLKSDDPLLNFIIELEIKLLGFGNSDGYNTFIKELCEEQRESIKKAIQKTKKEYKSESRIISDINIFMESSKFNQIRESLGIIRGK